MRGGRRKFTSGGQQSQADQTAVLIKVKIILLVNEQLEDWGVLKLCFFVTIWSESGFGVREVG